MASRPINVLSICSGVAGLDLGVRIALPESRVVCYIEREFYCAALLATRMESGALDDAPIWSDLASFDGKPWRGRIHLVIASLPCQPYSSAGKRAGHDDERAIWPEFIRVVGEVRPAIIFLENVPEFLYHFRPVGTRLQEMGYTVEEPLFLTAQEVGAPHRRERLFILAHNNGQQWRSGEPVQPRWLSIADDCRDVALSPSGRLRELRSTGSQRRDEDGTRSDDGLAGRSCGSDLPIFPPGPNDRNQWAEVLERCPELAPAIKPGFRLLDDGLAGVVLDAHRIDQLRAGGNGVVPLQAAQALVVLLSRTGGIEEQVSVETE